MRDDALIDDLAARQLGLVTRAQLRECGLTPDVIAARVRAKRLRPLHRGVYRAGPLVVPYTRELAAVLACGPHTCLSHRSAAWLWLLLPDPGDDWPVDVSMSQGDRGRRPNIRAHRTSLPAADMTTHENVPVTTVCRTIVDLAGVLDRRDLERVLAQADRLNLLDQSRLQLLTAQHAGRPGAPLLRSFIQNDMGPALTRSAAEVRFLELIRKAQLPQPETNVLIGDYEVDFLWRRERLVVEVDGFAFHSSPRSFENDRRRDARLTASGVSVLRVTWRQVVNEPEAMLARLAQTLARAGIDLVAGGTRRRRGAAL